MKASDRNVIWVLAGLALVLAFWFLVLGPKRHDASELSSKVTKLEASVDEQKQRIAYGEQARRDFPRDYAKLVVLGKAAPESADTASLIVQLNRIANGSGVEFRGMDLAASAPDTSAASAAAPTQPGLEQAPPVASQPSTTEPAPAPGAPSTSTASTTPAPAPAPATEATAAKLAIGSSVGPAGLEVLPYKLKFAGSFFDVAGLMQGVDRLVRTGGGRTVVDGRLSTVDGFSLSRDPKLGFPHLTASIFVTTYLTPPSLGLTGGATPNGPPAAPGEAPFQTASTQGVTP